MHSKRLRHDLRVHPAVNACFTNQAAALLIKYRRGGFRKSPRFFFLPKNEA